MNLFPEPRPGGRSGGEAGAARGCLAPAPSRRAAGLAGVWVWMPVPALSGTSGVSQPVPAPSPMLFFRRPFAEGLFRRPVLWVRCRFFVPGGTARTSSFSSLSPLRSDPSPLCPVPVPFRPRSVPVPSPFLSRSSPRPCPCPAPSLPCPCPCPCPCPVPAPSLSLSLSLSRSCPVPVPFLSPLRSVPFPSRSCPRPLFWRGAASSLFFGPRVEKPEKLFRFVISK